VQQILLEVQNMRISTMGLFGTGLFSFCLTACTVQDVGPGISTGWNTDEDTDGTGTLDTDTGFGTQDTGSLTQSDTSSEIDTSGCGNGVVEPHLGELCDDGNSLAGDGCSALCDEVENGFACPVPGQPCVSTVVCGDGKITGQEECDDGNKSSGDGCSSSCKVESGWLCPFPGQRCEAASCGDSIIAGKEECDDGNIKSGDGCSETCKREFGWACSEPGKLCHLTTCGDGIKEGDEACDDGNDVVGDGCSPFCQVEPSCAPGAACTSACGDGMILPGDDEECDDGNNLNGDGCSATCQIEDGFQCQQILSELPQVMEVPVTFRDFVALPMGGSVRHPDFEKFSGSQATKKLVEELLGSDGKPVYTGLCEAGKTLDSKDCPYGAQTTSQANFDQWYRNVPQVNVTRVKTLSLARQANGSYYYQNAAFLPLNNDGWVAQGLEAAHTGRNFGFTSEVRSWFEFKGDESLSFSGDDDVWVFIGGRLALDLGGLHPPRSDSFVLDSAKAASLGLEKGKLYEIALFHAERHTEGSNFNLTLGGFVSAKSHCAPICGDGIVTGDEVCDDGVNDGTYGSCLPDCKGRGDHCGDAVTQSEGGEECDDGLNLTVWSSTGEPGCAPGCVLGSYCGDGVIDALFGEECDDAGPSEKCTQDCRLGERCGDGIVQDGEECDDGNTVSGDGCDSNCMYEKPV
jgi:fibro-slime domain-containing protein